MENADRQPVPDLGQIDVKPEYCHLFLIHHHLQEEKKYKEWAETEIVLEKKNRLGKCVLNFNNKKPNLSTWVLYPFFPHSVL